MEVYQGDKLLSRFGIQINSSSRFVDPNGGVLPCTLTFTNFRYEKL